MRIMHEYESMCNGINLRYTDGRLSLIVDMVIYFEDKSIVFDILLMNSMLVVLRSILVIWVVRFAVDCFHHYYHGMTHRGGNMSAVLE
jgi:hypothetical protein